MISIRHLKKVYPNAIPFTDINLDIERGEIVSIIGPSGTGKSTLLRCVNLLETPTEGEIFVDGENITAKGASVAKLRRKMGMVFQSFNLFSHLTVIENIMAGPVDLLKFSRQKAYEEGICLLGQIGLTEKALNYPDELSGGQKQRVAIARAMGMHPEILLLDEPTSSLDPTMVGEVLSVIRALAHKGMTMIIVTHEMTFAREASTRVIYMDDGGVYEDGTPSQIFENSQRPLTRGFVMRQKTFIREMQSALIDFIGITSDIETFGRNLLLSQHQIRSIQLIFEEFCVQILFPRGREVFPIRFTVCVSEKDGKCETTISYNGPTFNPIEACDKSLPMQILAGFSKDQVWSEHGRNQIVFIM